MWLLSIVIAGLLIQLGGLIMSDVPTAGKRISQGDFVDNVKLEAIDARIDTLEATLLVNKNDIEDARVRLKSRSLDYNTQLINFRSWIATRTATEADDQNSEVIKRSHEIEALKLEERKAERDIERLEQKGVEPRRTLAALRQDRRQVIDAARPIYEKARKFEVLKVFMLRLALTLPLLLISAWMIAKKRSSHYWPIYRSFILFSLFAFFVELVPYLPSYGGYVRYIVGIAMALLFAHFSIKAMMRYQSNKKTEEQKPETEKRKLIEYETAVKKISDGVCPSCDRRFVTKAVRKSEKPPMADVDYCVHCGFCLFSKCTNCGTRENSFYNFCGTCGDPSKGSSNDAQA